MTLPPETEQLVRLLAQRSGRSPEDIVRRAVETEARIAGIDVAEARPPRNDIDLERVRTITRRIVSKPILDQRTPKDIRDEAWGEKVWGALRS